MTLLCWRAARRPTNAETTEPHHPQHAQRNDEHSQTQPTATATGTIQLVPRKTDESSSASLMTGDEHTGQQTTTATRRCTTRHRRRRQHTVTRQRGTYDSNQPKSPTRPHRPNHHTCQHTSTPANATVDDVSSRGSRNTTVSESQPLGVRPAGQWSEAQTTLGRTKAPK